MVKKKLYPIKGAVFFMNEVGKVEVRTQALLRIYHPNIKLTRERSRNWQASWYPAHKVYSKVKTKVYKRQTLLVYSEINVSGGLRFCLLLTSVSKESSQQQIYDVV